MNSLPTITPTEEESMARAMLRRIFRIRIMDHFGDLADPRHCYMDSGSIAKMMVSHARPRRLLASLEI